MTFHCQWNLKIKKHDKPFFSSAGLLEDDEEEEDEEEEVFIVW